MSTRHISRRYARAVFELIQEGAKLQDGLAALAAVAANVDVASVLASSAVPAGNKAAILVKASGKLPKELATLAGILCQRGKASLLPEISELVGDMVLQSQSEIVADVASATKLDAAAQKKIADALGKSLGRDVRLQVSEDKDLIGGLVVQIGDRQIDYSVRTRLQGLRKAIAG
jgi:F-type H+-transporting ATPase subunit delta